MLNKQEGITLVEVLATLILMTIVTGVIWTTISLAMKINISETTTLRLQQEANFITTRLQQIHRNCDKYEILFTTEAITVSDCDLEKGNPNSYERIVSTDFNYSISSPSIDVPYGIISIKESLYLSELRVSDPKNSKKAFTISTTISRIETGTE